MRSLQPELSVPGVSKRKYNAKATNKCLGIWAAFIPVPFNLLLFLLILLYSALNFEKHLE